MRPFCINCFNHQNLAAIDTYTDWKNIFVTNDVINTTNQYVIYINFNTHIGITTSIIRGYKMLLNTKCPSWLYEVRMGATTIWERWDGLDEKGVCPIGGDGTDLMISYNHYASGAVGAFLYQRVLGLEPETPGYKTFRFCPRPGGGLTWAKGEERTPYGTIQAGWTIQDGTFTAEITVPVNTKCTLTMPDGTTHTWGSGTYSCRCAI